MKRYDISNFYTNENKKQYIIFSTSLPPLYTKELMGQSCNNENGFTRILGIKKEPNG